MNKNENNKFVDLTPVNNADPKGIYSESLLFALEKDNVKNIALTGPYGSGKSSIIKTFEKNNDFNFLDISLASFNEAGADFEPNDEEGVEQRQDGSSSKGLSDNQMQKIEKSILQQMFYGKDANSLPLSRFKKIEPPKKSLSKSTFMILWILLTYFLFSIREDIINPECLVAAYNYDFCSFNWLKSVLLVLWLGGTIGLLKFLHEKHSGFSLKKISLHSIELDNNSLGGESILNKYLDEIIYFFQTTNYNVVVFEDLDRFGDPEIFVRLREINKLINDNAGTSGKIKFLYAIKDDMFSNVNRSKFFDYLIPVVPIINTSNSLDKMLDGVDRCGYKGQIEEQFLREVSLYLDDMRLINNIFNEYVVYHEQLKNENQEADKDSLNLTKLLAMMVYKNVYPNDFEKLHHQKGALYGLCEAKAKVVLVRKREIESEINDCKSLISSSENEHLHNLQELISIYLLRILSYAMNLDVRGAYIENNVISFEKLMDHQNFEKLAKEREIILQIYNSRYRELEKYHIKRSYHQIEKEVNTKHSYNSRKLNIENMSTQRIAELQLKKESLNVEASRLSKLAIRDLYIDSDYQIDEVLSLPNNELLIYLVRNGYLDENYYQYISNFHEGRLSKYDRDFLLTVRSFKSPKISQRIDNPKEVCLSMREEDFSQQYVLNVSLMDHLLQQGENTHLTSAIDFIEENFKTSEKFLMEYYRSGRSVKDLVSRLAESWEDYVKVAIGSSNKIIHIVHILACIDEVYLVDKMNENNILTGFISRNGKGIALNILNEVEDFSLFKSLYVKFESLTDLVDNKRLLDYIINEQLYEININNIEYMLRFTFEESDNSLVKIETENYTQIMESGNEAFIAYIESNIGAYVRDVFLKLPKNNNEPEASIVKLISNSGIYPTYRKQIIAKQKHIFKDLKIVEKDFWDTLFDYNKVEINWKNIYTYFSQIDEANTNEEEDKADELSVYLTNLLNQQKIYSTLGDPQISMQDFSNDESLELSRFLINNEDLTEDSYSALIQQVPYVFKRFPDSVEANKLSAIARVGKIELSINTLEFAKNISEALASELIISNIRTFMSNINDYDISDEVRELIVKSDTNLSNKVRVCEAIDPSYVLDNPDLAKLIGELLLRSPVKVKRFDFVVLKQAILAQESTDEKIKLLIECLDLWDKEKAMKVIFELGHPYFSIADYGKKPKIVKSKINLGLVEKLDERNFISSFSVDNRYIRINTFKSPNH